MNRIEREAEFQNRRTVAVGAEARDSFYWVIARAYSDLDDAIGAYAGRRVLVVGCAEGQVIPLARRGIQVTGIDIADKAVTKLRAAIEQEGLSELAEAHVMDAEDLRLPDASFDAVVASGVLHHLDLERALVAWRKVLRPNGEVLMVEPLALNPIVATYRWLSPGTRSRDEHPLLPRDFRVLRKHFGRVEIRPYGLLSLAALVLNYVSIAPGLRDRVLRALNGADRFLFRSIPPIGHLAWTAFVRCAQPRAGQGPSTPTGSGRSAP